MCDVRSSTSNAPTRLAVVGGGVSAGAFFRAFPSALRSVAHADRPVAITVFDSSQAIGAGNSFGWPSGPETLCSNTCQEVFPGTLLPRFRTWVVENEQTLVEDLRTHGDRYPSLRGWLRRNERRLHGQCIEALYFPRHVVGEFLRHEYEEVVRREYPERVCIRHVRDRVVGIRKEDEFRYEVRTVSGLAHTFELVLLAVGAASRTSRFPKVEDRRFIADPYEPSIERAIAAVREDSAGRSLLIIGSNATALELLYLLRHSERFRGHITVVSRSGSLPERIVSPGEPPVARRLESLLGTDGPPDVSKLVEAATCDILERKKEGYHANQLMHIVSRTVESVYRMPPEQQAEFCELHAWPFINRLRRAGGEYSDAVDHLVRHGRVTVASGDVREVGIRGGLPCATWVDSRGATHRRSFDWIIDASGWGDVRTPGDPLLCSLSAGPRPLITFNRTGRGVSVDDTMQASHNLFVFGPLLAGWHTQGRMIWHLESAARIEELAPEIAHHVACRV